jgi:hypothetical protein
MSGKVPSVDNAVLGNPRSLWALLALNHVKRGLVIEKLLPRSDSEQGFSLTPTIVGLLGRELL